MKRSIKELNLMDDFLFQEIVRNPEYGIEFCQILLGTLLRREVRIASVNTQEVLSPFDTDGHGIRLDVVARELAEAALLEAEEGTLFDVEMQKGREPNIGRRVRYYQSVSDARSLSSGEDYGVLPDLMTIVISPVDYFGRDRMLYTFESRCIEEEGLPMQDGATRIVIYTRGRAGSWDAARELLHYLEHSDAENALSPGTGRIHEMVTATKQNREAGVRYMRMLEQLNKSRAEGKAEGRTEGRIEGRTEGRTEGMAEGRQKGLEQINALNLELARVGRTEDILRAASNKEFQEKLFQEFGIVDGMQED